MHARWDGVEVGTSLIVSVMENVNVYLISTVKKSAQKLRGKHIFLEHDMIDDFRQRGRRRHRTLSFVLLYWRLQI